VYICEGIFDVCIYVAVTSPYPWDRAVTNYYSPNLSLLLFLLVCVPKLESSDSNSTMW